MTDRHVNLDSEAERIYFKIEDETVKLLRMGQEFATMSAGYKIAKAIAFSKAEGPMDLREQRALLITQGQLEVLEKAEKEYKDQRELLLSLRAQASMLQTMSANVRIATGG